LENGIAPSPHIQFISSSHNISYWENSGEIFSPNRVAAFHGFYYRHAQQIHNFLRKYTVLSDLSQSYINWLFLARFF